MLVKTYATFQQYSPPGTPLGEAFKVEVKNGTILEIVKKIGLPLDKGIIVMVNGIRITDLNQQVNSNDLIVFFPLLGGG